MLSEIALEKFHMTNNRVPQTDALGNACREACFTQPVCYFPVMGTTAYDDLIARMRSHSGQGTTHSADPKYMGSENESWNISVPVRRKVLKEWKRAHADLTQSQFDKILESLAHGSSYDEKVLLGLVLEAFPHLRQKVSPRSVQKWIGHLSGWAEIDSLCQSVFSEPEILGNWDDWSETLSDLSSAEGLSERRGALVLLTLPVRRCRDKRLCQLSLKVIVRQREVDDKVVTKAMSWLLREMCLNYPAEVREFLDQQSDWLPKFVVREVQRKLATGKR